MCPGKYMQRKGIRRYRPASRSAAHRAGRRPPPYPLDSAAIQPLGNLSAYRYAYHCEGSRMGFHAGFIDAAC